jgi:predicted MPP superfamily phosphohydrolase
MLPDTAIMARFAIFISIMVLILSSAVFYVGWRTIMFWPWAHRHPRTIIYTLVAFLSFQILWPFLSRKFPEAIGQLGVLHWLAYGTLGLFVTLFFYFLFYDLAWFGISKILKISDTYSPYVFYSVAFITVFSFLVGLGQAIKGPSVREIIVKIAGLPDGLSGYRIVQLSDLHVSRLVDRAYVEKIVGKALELKPDLIAMTGDFADGAVSELKNAMAPLRGLKAPDGIYFVTGNHEYYWDLEHWLEEYPKYGIRILQNSHVLIEHNKARLVLAGVNDPTGGDSDPVRAIRGAPAEVSTKILLAHQPDAAAKEAVKAGYSLQLSGHTHGGQFFPWSLMVWLFQKHYRGLSHEGAMQIYTSRGAAFWGPPLRFLIPAEITLIKLEKK